MNLCDTAQKLGIKCSLDKNRFFKARLFAGASHDKRVCCERCGKVFEMGCLLKIDAKYWTECSEVNQIYLTFYWTVGTGNHLNNRKTIHNL